MRRLWLGLAFTLALVGGPSRGAEPAETTAWFTLYAEEGEKVGRIIETVTVRPDGREIVDEQEITVREQGAPVTRIVQTNTRREDAQGRTVFLSLYSLVGREWTRIEATIRDGRAVIVRRTASGHHQSIVPLPPAVRFDAGEGLLAGWDPAATPSLEFDNFNLDFMVVEHVAITPATGAPPTAAPTANGGMSVLRSRYEGGSLQGVSRLTLDARRDIVAVVLPRFGTSLTVRITDRATALAPYEPYRVLPKTMTKSPFRIPPGALQGHIRYRFTFQDGLEFPLPQTGEQKAVLSGGAAVVDICETCGPGLPTDPAYLADALKPTAWLQSDHPKVRAIAARVINLKVSDTRRMQMLVEAVVPRLGRIDFTGHFSAVDALNRHAGDCTEAAVILAAAARAAGIPAKVVNGLVYSRERYHGVSNAFLPHSWVLAYVDGHWKSFDAALLTFDSSHIALTVGDGEARSLAASGQLASLLDWRDLAEVRARP
ncbi:hypothetical protein QO010_002164 [Caulobacter ginsengisoli]|uniref:Transglutaminase-like domain-containing protein n=1 Tax=Caulobacter ginsengisoli TaxID=400775 RepID=A0ABU0IT99_9CAUL|nr:transglutaminase domain-containing protein [Caulobacter ginsengisoli]MDQ0464383.1 hypothetical protein [Caulobacter ginsengisoli]